MPVEMIPTERSDPLLKQRRMHVKLQVTDVAPATGPWANVDHERKELSVLRLVGLREI